MQNTKYSSFVFLIIMLLLSIASVHAKEQDRRALWQAKFKKSNPVGRTISDIDEQSPLEQAGLKVGDLILTIDETRIVDSQVWYHLTDSLRGNKEYQIQYRRDGQLQRVSVTFPPAPYESYDGLTTEYDFVVSDYGIKHRTITTFPSSKKDKLPAVMVVGGLSCSSIEYTPGRKSNFIKSLQYFVQNVDMVVMRVEKPGIGDSSGDCSNSDFKTDLNGFETALSKMLRHPKVDPTKVIIYGSSMGSAIAPYLANKYELKGVISDGTFYRSWFEHMLEIERRIKTMQGNDQAEVNRLINKVYIPLYYGMLIEKKSYQQVVDDNPLLEKYNYHAPAHMYGRPVEYYHQVQDFDFAGNWQRLKAPARIRWGTNDWIMSEYDIDMIGEVLSAAGNTNVVISKVVGMDHWDAFHKSAEDSFNGEKGVWKTSIPQQLIDWAKELVR